MIYCICIRRDVMGGLGRIRPGGGLMFSAVSWGRIIFAAFAFPSPASCCCLTIK